MPTADLPDAARSGDPVENMHSARHSGEELGGDRAIDRDAVFLLVAVRRAQQVVDDIAVIRQQEQALGVLVEAADRKDALAVCHEADHIVRNPGIGRALDADRLVKRDVHVRGLIADDAAIDPHRIAFQHLRAESCDDAVDAHAAAGYPGIGLATRAQAALAQELVDPHMGQYIESLIRKRCAPMKLEQANTIIGRALAAPTIIGYRNSIAPR